MNQVQVTGRLVRDPETRQLPDGRPVCTVRLAVEGMGRGNDVGYVDVTAFGPAAAAAARTLTKGWLVAANGRMDYREWDARNGERRSAIGLVGHIEFLSRPRTTPNRVAEPDPVAA
jgi:single-strand DNA-binding protein